MSMKNLQDVLNALTFYYDSYEQVHWNAPITLDNVFHMKARSLK